MVSTPTAMRRAQPKRTASKPAEGLWSSLGKVSCGKGLGKVTSGLQIAAIAVSTLQPRSPAKKKSASSRIIGRLRTGNSSWKNLYRHSTMPRWRRMAKIDFLQHAHVLTLLICVFDCKRDFERISLNGLCRWRYSR